MNDEQREPAEGDFGTGSDFEERVRGLLTEDAYTVRPSPVPYPAIRRRGTLERRRRVAAAGAALVTLAALPVGAYALNGGEISGTAAPRPSVSAPAAPTTTPAAPPAPGRPATPGQLLDGITWAQAEDGLEKCVAFDRSGPYGSGRSELGKASDYRIILAMHSTGDSNAPGDGMFVVAVPKDAGPQEVRLICTLKDGRADGLNTSSGDAPNDAGAVFPDMNGGKLYQQSILDRGNWKLPFRWGAIGTVDPSVARVTVSYGGGTVEGVLDHGWFVAYGILDQQVTKAPHVKGYDAADRLVYDSDQDKYYEKTLP
ncbi:hypothetical protein ACWCQK_15875 [Streptomyces sp. NPDC002306]